MPSMSPLNAISPPAAGTLVARHRLSTRLWHWVNAVDSLQRFGQGRGGYWEDQINYEWYAGI